jgi:Tfp pilus assembly protein PilO
MNANETLITYKQLCKEVALLDAERDMIKSINRIVRTYAPQGILAADTEMPALIEELLAAGISNGLIISVLTPDAEGRIGITGSILRTRTDRRRRQAAKLAKAKELVYA